ncbi:unnamed protein product [Rotaria sp. Silwood2]|nr:unnamed protein product [Rotaria sp. Silwood2]
MHKNDTIWTAIRKADKQALKQIINVNPDVINIRGPVGECPIHMLFLYGTEAHLDIARYLITQFPHIVTQIYNQSIDSNGNTILHMLVIHNLPEIYTKFKERWLRDKNLTESFDTYDTNMTEISNKQEVLLWNRMNKDGLTPMTLAAKLGRAKMLSFLLDERKILLWAYGDISCLLHPLDQLDLDLIEKTEDQYNKTATIGVKYLTVSYPWICNIGRVIVLAGALWKGGLEIKEMSSIGLYDYLQDSVSLFFLLLHRTLNS